MAHVSESFKVLLRSHFCHIVIVVAVLLSLVSAHCSSPCIDEAAHVAAGLSHLRLSSFELYTVNPPLLRSIASLPLVASEPAFPIGDVPSMPAVARSEFSIGGKLVSFLAHRTPFAFFKARCCLFFLIPCLLIMGHQQTVRTVRGGGRTFLVLCATCPSCIAFSSVVGPDYGAAVAALGVSLAGRRYVANPTIGNAGVFGVAASFGVLTKFTILAVILVVGAIIVVNQIIHAAGCCRIVCHILFVGSVVSLCVNASYAYDNTGCALGDIACVSSLFRGDMAKESCCNRFSHSLASDIPIPIPSKVIQGIDLQRLDFERGSRSYLMGEWRKGGWWYYYFLGFLVKEPIGFQVLLFVNVIAGLLCMRRWTKESVLDWAFVVLPPIAIFGLVSSQTGFNHHMRYVLPAYPFLFIIAARSATLSKRWRWFSHFCVAWQVIAALLISPHWFSYFNEFAGGPKNGHRWLVNSNIDWGQDIYFLKSWQDENQFAGPLHAAIFTGFDPRDIGLKFELPAPYIKGRPELVNDEGLRGPQPGWYAISVSLGKGMHTRVPVGNGEWRDSTGEFSYLFNEFSPVKMIGYSIYVYYVSEVDAARVRDRLLSEEYELLKLQRESLFK